MPSQRQRSLLRAGAHSVLCPSKFRLSLSARACSRSLSALLCPNLTVFSLAKDFLSARRFSLRRLFRLITFPVMSAPSKTVKRNTQRMRNRPDRPISLGLMSTIGDAGPGSIERRQSGRTWVGGKAGLECGGEQAASPFRPAQEDAGCRSLYNMGDVSTGSFRGEWAALKLKRDPGDIRPWGRSSVRDEPQRQRWLHPQNPTRWLLPSAWCRSYARFWRLWWHCHSQWSEPKP